MGTEDTEARNEANCTIQLVEPISQSDLRDILQPNLGEYLQDSNLEFEVRILDVSGDGGVDVIASSWLSVSILLSHGSSYCPPSSFVFAPSKYGSGTSVSFADWTGDRIPEIVIDYLSESGGTGLSDDSWLKTVIECAQSDCRIIWQDVVVAIMESDRVWDQGLAIFEAQPTALIDAGGRPLVVQESSAFALSMSADIALSYLPDLNFRDLCGSEYVCTLNQSLGSFLKLYEWNGRQFVPIFENSLSEPARFPEFSIRQFGQLTTPEQPPEISARNGEMVFTTKECEVQIAGEVLGDVFHCYPNYSVASLMDITGDGREELVIKALAGPYNIQGELLTSNNCIHARMLVYGLHQSGPRLLANVDGCVVREDLYGVRLEDIDGDSLPEIIAAAGLYTQYESDPKFNRWREFNTIDQIYKWNGEQFEYVDDSARR